MVSLFLATIDMGSGIKENAHLPAAENANGHLVAHAVQFLEDAANERGILARHRRQIRD